MVKFCQKSLQYSEMLLIVIVRFFFSNLTGQLHHSCSVKTLVAFIDNAQSLIVRPQIFRSLSFLSKTFVQKKGHFLGKSSKSCIGFLERKTFSCLSKCQTLVFDIFTSISVFVFLERSFSEN